MGGIRFLIVGGSLLLWTIFYLKEKITAELWRFGWISGFLLFFVGGSAVILAEKNLPSGLVSILAGVVPFWILILDRQPGPDRFKNPFSWIGLVLGFSGVVLLFEDKLSMKDQNPNMVWSFLIMIIGGIGWAQGTLYSKYNSVKNSTISKMSVQALTACTFFFVAALFKGEYKVFEWSQVSSVSWIALAYLIVFGSMIGYFSYLWLLSHVSAHAISTHSFVNPIVAVALGTLIAGEVFYPKDYISLVLVILGLVAMVISKQKSNQLFS